MKQASRYTLLLLIPSILFSPFTFSESHHYSEKHSNKKNEKVVVIVKKPKHKVGYKRKHMPKGATRVVVKKNNYYFYDGFYYRSVRGQYQVVASPHGARVKVLPAGYRRIVIGVTPYFIFEGTYYLYKENTRDYVVVTEPHSSNQVIKMSGQYIAGEVYSELPENTESVQRNGMQYFRYGSLYFLPQVSHGGVVYLAVKLN
ncbi:DUF6515 family protein [Shewanella surugensis]|uniref:DUF6515 family protein n=2 Tax=Shewanella surugensis TaxID=212020 RepID=A0ABT0LCB1_9GAMM|nr:DUF6515 family protein [Shewanella surugensis]MCL1125308.1 DUF6515 family protein [Shewanella surugensis]